MYPLKKRIRYKGLGLSPRVCPSSGTYKGASKNEHGPACPFFREYGHAPYVCSVSVLLAVFPALYAKSLNILWKEAVFEMSKLFCIYFVMHFPFSLCLHVPVQSAAPTEAPARAANPAARRCFPCNGVFLPAPAVFRWRGPRHYPRRSRKLHPPSKIGRASCRERV